MLDVLDKTLDRLKVLYEQYFLGIQKSAPAYLHTDVERKLRDLTQISIRNTGLRYRFATLQQKFGSYNSYWRRTLRQIENGTYGRNLSKIGREAARSGEAIPEEILAAMPKRMREQVVRDRELALATNARRKAAKGEELSDEELLTLAPEAATPELPPEPDEDDGPAMISEPTELRRSLKTRGGAHVIDDSDETMDLDSFFASVEQEKEPAVPVQRATPVPTGAAPPANPAARQTGAVPPIAARATGAVPPANPAARQTGAVPPANPAARQTGPVPPANPAARQTGIVPPTNPEAARQTGPVPSTNPAARQTGVVPSTHPGAAGAAPTHPSAARPPGVVPANPAARQTGPVRVQPDPDAAAPDPVAAAAAARQTGPVRVQPDPAQAAARQTGPVRVPVPPGTQPGTQAPPSRQTGPVRVQPDPAQVASPSDARQTQPVRFPSQPGTQPVAPVPIPSRQTGPVAVLPEAPQNSEPAIRPPASRFPAQDGTTPGVAAGPRPGIPTPAVGIGVVPKSPAAIGPKPLVPAPPAAVKTAMPAMPALPKVPAPNAPSQNVRPNPIAPGAAAAYGAVEVESMSGPFAREPRAEPAPPAKPAAAPQPEPAKSAAASPKPATRPTPRPQPRPEPGPPQRPPPGMTDADVNALYAKYVKAKQMVGEDVGPGGHAKLLKTINQQAPKIMEQYKAKAVDFSIVVKDNQVIIRAKPKT
ncbi:MAG: hypothetical protein JWO36_6435 [Myxococcales bacterium]|nr:hypothetical protein [Myxococcales bacterium]